MRVLIRHQNGLVLAMGHRVPEGRDAAAEVKRRCLETLSRCSSPPDEIQFVELGAPIAAGPRTALGPGVVRALRPPTSGRLSAPR